MANILRDFAERGLCYLNNYIVLVLELMFMSPLRDKFTLSIKARL